MGKIIGSAPILLVTDVVASANYYRDQLGFKYDRFWGEPAAFCILRRDNFHLMLSLADKKHVIPHWKSVSNMWNIYFWVDDVDAFYEDVKDRGAKIDYELTNKDYGCREFGVQDLDGYDIAFAQDLDE